MVETEHPKEKRVPPVRASQPALGIGERKGPNIPPIEWVNLIVMVVGIQMEMEVPMAMAVAHMEIEDQMGMETPQ